MKFNIGDRVLHRSKDKEATVVNVDGDVIYIKHSGFTWSVKETAILRLVNSGTYKAQKAVNALQPKTV